MKLALSLSLDGTTSCQYFMERMNGTMISYEQELACIREIVEFQHYLFGKIEERRTTPRDDLITHMVTARVDGFGGRSLSTQELISMIDIILLGGMVRQTALKRSFPTRTASMCADPMPE